MYVQIFLQLSLDKPKSHIVSLFSKLVQLLSSRSIYDIPANSNSMSPEHEKYFKNALQTIFLTTESRNYGTIFLYYLINSRSN